MKLFNYDNIKEKNLGSIQSEKEIEVGSYYEATDIVHHTVFKGKSSVLIEEVATKKGTVLITDEKGSPPFAAFTNDSKRDVFLNENALSKVVAQVGFHVVFAKNPVDDITPLDVYIFEITNIEPDSMLTSVILKCIYVGTTILPIPNFERVTEHLVKVSRQVDLPSQLKDKYCFQTTRRVMLCFMSKDEDCNIVSKRDKNMILNYNSPSRYMRGELVTEGVYRVYYSRKFKNSDEVYVEGVRVDDEHLNFDIEEFIKSTDSNIRGNIRILTTRNGRKLYAVVNSRGEIRPIIKLGNFTSFALSKEELETNIVDITML